MSEPDLTAGPVAFGSVLGDPVPFDQVVDRYTDDVERVRAYGYRTLHLSPESDGLTDLAERAAQRALDEAGITAADLDLVVLAITDIPEYLYWDPAASLQDRLGAAGAEALLVAQGCIGGITCLDTVLGRFATHPDYRRALVVGANRTCEQYWNRMDTHSLLFSDGAAACIVARDRPVLRLRAFEVISDGRYADFFRMDIGGAAAPFDPDCDPPAARDAWDNMEFFDYDPDRFEAFIDLLDSRVLEVVDRACKRVGRTVADLDRIVLNNDNEKTVTPVARLVGLPTDRTNLALSLDHGHLGAADYLFGLEHLVRSGQLGSGLVAVAGVGRGMHWACALLEC